MQKKNNDIIFISWERHRRTRTLAKKINIPLFEIVYSGNSIFRYSYCIIKTVKTILNNSPKVIIVQTPSYVLAFFCTLLKQIFGFKLVVDAHNGVTYRLNKQPSLTRWFVERSVKNADLIVVTNDTVFPILDKYETKRALLPDCIPDIPKHPPPKQYLHHTLPAITVISSFQHDEPIQLILDAFLESNQASKAHLFVTGRLPEKHAYDYYLQKNNITFTGYLSFEDFDGLISNSNLLIDISTDPTVLVCGGYEAMAVEVPCVVSSSSSSKSVFESGFLYSRISTEDCRRAIEDYFLSPKVYQRDIKAYKAVFNTKWDKLLQDAELKIRALTGDTA
ncbi:glycosyltransferase [Pseudomonadales bacterium]|nr:glycosyltransferase [Pseudomonadales bacterium]